MKTFDLPDLGEGLHEAEIVAWHVAPGDQVVADQPLVSVETDKAIVEVPAPFGGRVAKLFAEAGTTVAVGAPLVGFEHAGTEDSGTVAGRVPDGDVVVDSERPRTRSGGARVKAAPAVRALAERLGVDLTGIESSNADGHITADDVKRAAGADEAVTATGERLRGVRRAMAQRMAEAHASVVPATVCDEADIDGWREGSDVTVRLVEAIVAGCAVTPSMNAWYDGARETLTLHKRIELGLAVDTSDGLLVPVLRNIGARERADLRQGVDALKRDATSRRIPPEELRGATITLSNFGAVGVGRFAGLVVIPPQVAIVGAGRIAARVTLRDGRAVERRTLPLSLTFDHRVVNGGEAVRFLAAMMEALAQSD
ncbi:MAG: 2-oxo acid dehydrogenase subunit E2 [Alphaproteobacteria bacterium]|nr:2-oxo acid dehydrogenase subunit E2 [Alphaproteobacteria bacterium]